MAAFAANDSPGDYPESYQGMPISEEAALMSGDSNDDDSGSDFGDDDATLAVISMPESIYSDIVITFARGHIPEVTSSLILTIICVIVQILLADIMAGQLAGDGAGIFDMVEISGAPDELSQFNGQSMFDMWSRTTTKGNSCDMNIQKKWWACNQLSWSYYADASGEMANYFTTNRFGMYQGYLFGGIALFLWMGYQTMELKSIVNYGQLLFLPSAANQLAAGSTAKEECKHYTFNREEGCGHLRSLNLPGKIVVCLITLARLYICYNLTQFGAQFLCYTSELKDFLLNSVALVFVYDIDDLFFTVFLSARKQRRVTTLEPPKVYGVVRDIHHLMGGTTGEYAGIIITAVMTWICLQEYLVPFTNAYLQAYYGMCGEALGEDFAGAESTMEFVCRDQNFNSDDLLRPPGGNHGPPSGLMQR